MSAIWFKCFPSDFLNGMASLDEYERGIYVSLIFIMYDQGGLIKYENHPKKGNAKALARQCGTSTRRFNSTVEILINDGKLIHKNGYLANKRVFTGIFLEFISDFTLNYLVLMFPKWRKYNDLAWRKKLEARIQKKNNNKKGVKLVAGEGSLVPDFEYAVSKVHGPMAWSSWFSGSQFEDNIIYPQSEFISSRLRRDYEQIISDNGYIIGPVRQQEKSA